MTSAIDNFRKFLYETPASPFVDVLLNGTVADLLDAAHRAENTRTCRVWSWIDSSLAHLSTAITSVFRLVHDLIMTLIFAPAWPFSDTARKSCKIHLFRSAIDLVGVIGGVAGVFYPPVGMHLLTFVLEQIAQVDTKEIEITPEGDKSIGKFFRDGYEKFNEPYWDGTPNPIIQWSKKIF